MPKQLGLLGDNYWFSLITAAPQPEIPERATVGVLFGNGKPFLLRFHHDLPRISGIAPIDEARVLEAILDAAAKRVVTGSIELPYLKNLIGPQLIVEEPREILAEFGDGVVDRICRRYLLKPNPPTAADRVLALISQSTRSLDAELQRADIHPDRILKKVSPARLYSADMGRFVRFKVPQISRAVRGPWRDVLVDSLRISDEFDPMSIRSATSRIGQTFFAYDRRLRPVIRERFGREIKLVGVLQPSPPKLSDETRLMREFTGEMWSKQNAMVIDGDVVDIPSALSDLASWAAAEVQP